MLRPLDVRVDGRPAGPRGAKRRSLLAILAARANEPVSMDALVEGLWGEAPPPSAVGVVQTYVSTWRKAFDDVADEVRISRAGSGYTLVTDARVCDVLAFRQLREQAASATAAGELAVASRTQEAALAVFTGPALGDLTGEPFHAEVVRRLEDERTEVLEQWADCVLTHRGGGAAASVVAALQAAHAADPWRERLVELLLWALFALGRQREALALYESVRSGLAEELGVDPGPRLRDMHLRVLQQDPGLLQADGFREGTALPRDQLIGRDGELAEVRELLRHARLVTLVGPGGSGKSRLAEEVAAESRARAVESVVVELAPVRDVELAPAAIAAQLGLTAAAPLRGLITQLADRSLLVVLDDVEHLPGIAAVVAALLEGTSRLRLLVTSREALRIRGEQQYPVRPLPVPDADESDRVRLLTSPAVQLLVSRARATDPAFEVLDGDVSEVRDIARRLDGLPLALEIAAPWLPLLTAAGVLTELARPLDLAGRRTDVAERHTTLRAAIQWSDQRLDDEQRRVLQRLSVFRGGAALDAITAVCGHDAQRPVPISIADLVDRNLLQRAAPLAGQPRFRMLETVRAYASESLHARGAAADAERRHAEWYAERAVVLAAHSEGPLTPAWQAWAVTEADDLRAALEHFQRRGEPDRHLQLAVDCMALWFEAGHEVEGERRLAAALDAASPDCACRPIACAYLAWLCGTHDRPRAASLAAQAVEGARRADDAPVLAFALQTLGDTLDDVEAAELASREALEVAAGVRGIEVRYGPTASDAVACGATYTLAALVAHRHVPTALRWQREALTLAEREGDRRITAVNAARLGLLHVLGGDPAAAAEHVHRASAMIEPRTAARWEDIVAFAEAQLAHAEGRTSVAVDRYATLVHSTAAGGRPLHLGLGSCGLVDALLELGDVPAADAALHRAETALTTTSSDDRQRARLLVRRARLHRLAGRHEQAQRALALAGQTFEPAALTPERIIWFVESSLLARHDLPRRQLRQLASDTGVAIPRWELALLLPATESSSR